MSKNHGRPLPRGKACACRQGGGAHVHAFVLECPRCGLTERADSLGAARLPSHAVLRGGPDIIVGMRQGRDGEAVPIFAEFVQARCPGSGMLVMPVLRTQMLLGS